ncbi:uncharacterized protein [Asterias amurensis]|uniref:uncharacterized protein isoform X1 n=1 Tax=Asterias amurensis TaxID=7602 RepID=UPI003AB5A979
MSGKQSKLEIEKAIKGIRDDLDELETIKERITTRLDSLQALYTENMEADISSPISVLLEYIPGVGSLYQASRTFVNSLQYSNDLAVNPVALSIIGGTVKDFLHFNNIHEEGVVVTVHSLFENLTRDAFGRILDTLEGHMANREKVESVVRRYLRVINLSKKCFLLVHHLEENDPFHKSFQDNRVRLAKYALSKGAVYNGLISYDRYADKSLITVSVPLGFKEGAPVTVSWKLDQTWAGKQNVIVTTKGTFGKCNINSSNPDQQSVEIEMLRNETYYWFVGTLYIGNLEMLDGDDEPEEYQLNNSYIELKMFAKDPNEPLGNITRLDIVQKSKD